MPTFPSRSRAPPAPWVTSIRKRPFLFFGVPFLSLVVISSFALQEFTKTRYDYHGQKTKTLTQEEALRMDKGRKRVDIREEYYRLNAPPGQAPSESSLDASLSSPSAPASAVAVEDTPVAPKKRPRLSFNPVGQEEYEPVRVPRPAGMPEWGPAPVTADDAPLKGQRKEDRWV